MSRRSARTAAPGRRCRQAPGERPRRRAHLRLDQVKDRNTFKGKRHDRIAADRTIRGLLRGSGQQGSQWDPCLPPTLPSPSPRRTLSSAAAIPRSGGCERLYRRYTGVWHGEFQHVAQAPSLIASRFRVRNTTHKGEFLYKNNANFFRVRDGLFDEVFVYMSGENSLT